MTIATLSRPIRSKRARSIGSVVICVVADMPLVGQLLCDSFISCDKRLKTGDHIGNDAIA